MELEKKETLQFLLAALRHRVCTLEDYLETGVLLSPDYDDEISGLHEELVAELVADLGARTAELSQILAAGATSS